MFLRIKYQNLYPIRDVATRFVKRSGTKYTRLKMTVVVSALLFMFTMVLVVITDAVVTAAEYQMLRKEVGKLMVSSHQNFQSCIE